jgi:hypothetical protein
MFIEGSIGDIDKKDGVHMGVREKHCCPDHKVIAPAAVFVQIMITDATVRFIPSLASRT